MKFFLTKILISLAVISLSLPSQAIWFEASGQAVIQGGNKEQARQRATQEAIKQALLFAGASVRSVQSMAHGLLKDDRFEIRAMGEVSSVELVNEIYQDDYVTVTVRADIFPQNARCEASDYRKSVITTHFPMENRHQATIGGLFNLGKPFSGYLKEEFDVYSQYAQIKKVEPFFFHPDTDDVNNQAMQIARNNGAQFVLLGSIKELSMEELEKSYLDYLTFWNKKDPLRTISFHAKLIDGSTGELLMDEMFRASAAWNFSKYEVIDVNSNKMWNSSFGQSMKQIIQDVAQQVDETVSCIPAYGRILEVRNNNIAANIGSSQGVKQGDELSIFQMRQFFNPRGDSHFQYEIHPAKVVVAKVYHNSSVLRVTNNIPLGNIQPNDFVVRH